jgi:hydrogenase maturation protein HypF
MAERAQIIVRGIVQGVGFRPFVFNLAESLDLKGYVANTSEGVLIEVEGARVGEFAHRLQREAPPLSQISDVSVNGLPLHGYADFTIRASTDAAGGLPFTLVSPDVSICDDCLKEMLDPADRRYLYPFINCTNCGPRYSITRSIPYDRPNTTMADFTQCPDCLAEYHDPRNRRFHAQPNACPVCGPRVQFRVRGSEFGVDGGEAIRKAIEVLQNGGIVALKGIGGLHVACDATNDEAVKRLREKKRKSNKPFAVMAPSIDSAQQFCMISEDEKKLLLSSRRPVVLLRKRMDCPLSDCVSPSNQFIGVMLPYTPLHHLLFYRPPDVSSKIEGPYFAALVMTSGNLSEEPIVRDNEEAVMKLAGITDGFLLHNRDIFMRVDDSVVRVMSPEFGVRSKQLASNPAHTFSPNSELRTTNSELSFIRRSRGYAPDPIMLSAEGPEVMGCGADLKNTFTLTKGKFAIMSQHIGDMENYETVKFFEESFANLKAVYRADPKVIVHDLHPGYLSTQWAINHSELRTPNSEIKRVGIQHHYAHIGSVMAERGIDREVIGIALDGTGYGLDGNLWGGEFLIAGIDGFERAGQFQYVPLPGGEAAIREPWKTAVSYIVCAAKERAWEFLDKAGFVHRYGRDILERVATVSLSKELSPLSSGAGRLFDAVSSLLGICDENSFEGEAAMALESWTRDGIEGEYPVEFMREKGYTVINFDATLIALINDIYRTVGKEIIATKFHNTVCSVIRSMAGSLSGHCSTTEVALGGGTFQNQYLLNRTARLLSSDGMNVFINRKVPCNDGGISLGQAYLVRERLKKSGVLPIQAFEGRLRSGVQDETNAR